MADDARKLGNKFRFASAAAGLAPVPLPVLTSDDGLAPEADALVRAIQVQGGKKVTTMHVATDHSWSDDRIALESTILKCLSGLR